MNLSELKLGDQAVITKILDPIMSLKLMEMGCLPGEPVKIQRFAPFGGPVAIEILGYVLSLRLDEASVIVVEPICFN